MKKSKIEWHVANKPLKKLSLGLASDFTACIWTLCPFYLLLEPPVEHSPAQLSLNLRSVFSGEHLRFIPHLTFGELRLYLPNTSDTPTYIW
jgi:hypothetical protein